jgi:hypothetical protein
VYGFAISCRPFLLVMIGCHSRETRSDVKVVV